MKRSFGLLAATVLAGLLGDRARGAATLTPFLSPYTGVPDRRRAETFRRRTMASKYMPHCGQQERQRRVLQIWSGRLRAENGLLVLGDRS